MALLLGACGSDADDDSAGGSVDAGDSSVDTGDSSEDTGDSSASTGDSSEDAGVSSGDSDAFIEEYAELNGQSTQRGVPYLEVDIPEDHRFVPASEEEIRDLLDDGDGVIYFGFPSCPWCRNAVGPLDEAAKEVDLEINYVNPSTMREQRARAGDDYYELLLEELGEFAPEHPQRPGERTILVPLVATVVDGEVVAAHLGSAPSQTDPSQALTQTQHDELVGIYTDQFSQIP